MFVMSLCVHLQSECGSELHKPGNPSAAVLHRDIQIKICRVLTLILHLDSNFLSTPPPQY